MMPGGARVKLPRMTEHHQGRDWPAKAGRAKTEGDRGDEGQLEPEALGELARRLQIAAHPGESTMLREAIINGFYGRDPSRGPRSGREPGPRA